MECPRCRIVTVGSRCPNCGGDLTAPGPSQTNRVSSRPFPGWTGSAAVQEEELRERIRSRRLERSQKTRKSRPQVSSPKTRSDASAKRPLFDYKLPSAEEDVSRRKVVAFTGQTQPARTTEKPMIRRPVRPRGGQRTQPPKQGVLTLEAPLPAVNVPAGDKARRPETVVSHEVLLSRLLAGMIDLGLPLLTGVAFGLLGTTLLGTDFFAEGSLRLTLLLGLSFFFFNSFFFLLLSGQTPGMYWTDLELVSDDAKPVSLPALSLRILLFLPIVVSLVGLLTSVVDPHCRCLHDRLSGTRVVPSSSRAA